MRRRLTLLVLAASLLGLGSASAASACQCAGCPPTACGPTAGSGAGSLAVRPSGPRGPLVSYAVGDGQIRFALPAGVASADGRRYVTAVRRHERTTLGIFDARTATAIGARTVAGGWNLGGVSGNGRWIALVRPRRGATAVRLVDARTGAARTFELRGWFDVDAVANDGLRVFLIQYVRAGYLIRFYDLARRQLAVRVLTERGEPMQGTAWGAVSSPDGRRVMTLYLRGRSAEVHTLDLARGTALCIDLPRGTLDELRAYSLALAPGGTTLYAANPALGVVATVDLARLRVTRVVRFHPVAHADTASRGAAVSHDGRTVYFASGSGVYAYDAAFRRVRGRYGLGGGIAGMAFGRADRYLRLVRRDGSTVRLVAATGRRG
jgi:DNA-binding beta-propeller fold protein YncE